MSDPDDEAKPPPPEAYRGRSLPWLRFGLVGAIGATLLSLGVLLAVCS